MATLHLASALLRKAVASVTDRPAKSTERLDRASASQLYAWVFVGPDVLFTDTGCGSSLSVGSFLNAWAMSPDDFDCVINCCPREGTLPRPRTHLLDLVDTDDVSLEPILPALETALADARRVMATAGGRVLCHCWMGASRSVAVAIYLLCRIYGHETYDSPEDAFMHYYCSFKRCRPCINVGVQLMREVCRVLRQTS
jgi:hypothetical protein